MMDTSPPTDRPCPVLRYTHSGGGVAGGGGLLRLGAPGHLARLAVRLRACERQLAMIARSILFLAPMMDTNTAPLPPSYQEMQDAAAEDHLCGGPLRCPPVAGAALGGGRPARPLEPLRRVLQRRGAWSLQGWLVIVALDRRRGLWRRYGWLPPVSVYPHGWMPTNNTKTVGGQVVGDDPLPKDRSVLYAVIPHGTFPFGLGVVRACVRACVRLLRRGHDHPIRLPGLIISSISF